MRQTDKFISIDNIVDAIRDKQANKYDCKIAITGWLGKGKSTLGYQLGKKITEDFMIPNNFIFEASEETIGKKVLELKKSAIVIDEAIDVLYKMDWASELQNALLNLMTKTRHRRHAIILCIPYFTELRRSFRNNLIDFWIHIPRRGAAVAFGKTPCIYDDDPWHMKENAKKFWDSTKGVSYLELIGDTDKQVELYEKTPGCIGYFTFDPMPDGDQKEFDTLSEAAKDKSFGQSHMKDRSIRYKKMMYRLSLAIELLNKKYHMTQEDIGQFLNIKQQNVSEYIQDVSERRDINAEPAANQNQP